MSNYAISLTQNLIFQLLLTTTILITFCYHGKKLIFKISPVVAIKTTVIKQYSLTQITGVIELSLVASCHVLFCALLLSISNTDILTIFKNTSVFNCFYGILIGVGSVGISILFCTLGMKIIESFSPETAPKTLDGWMAVANAGWIRHHKHTLKVLPFLLALLIITMQIGSEEIIFRAVLTNVFIQYGATFTFISSTILFVFMQTLHMPSKTSAMFPVIGAIVMGITHEFLYLEDPSVIPLIISHLTFFIFTVL